MAYADPAELYIVVIITVMVEEGQGGEGILMYVFNASGVEGSLSLLG